MVRVIHVLYRVRVRIACTSPSLWPSRLESDPWAPRSITWFAHRAVETLCTLLSAQAETVAVHRCCQGAVIVQAASDSSDGDSNFDADEEDEEIDEGLAFTADDEAKYGNWFERDDDDEDSSGDEDEGPEEWDDEEAEEAPPARAAGAAAALIDDADTWLGATSDGDATSDGNEEDGGDQGGDEDDEDDPAHAAMLDAVLARKRKARQHLEPIGEAIAEGGEAERGRGERRGRCAERGRVDGRGRTLTRWSASGWRASRGAQRYALSLCA